ncbi:ROK family protein [Dactylosporangium sp. NPDC051541]|uniref:ROK family protein n=1 Tax=Dactylosporangium sp. NPDC051541 TaxID=3363977 RepID=UPI0037B93103
MDGSHYVGVGIAVDAGRLLIHATDRYGRTLLRHATSAPATRVVDELRARGITPAAIVVGVPGAADDEVPLAAMLREALGGVVPVGVDSAAGLAAAAEHATGAHGDDLVFVFGGAEVGAGIVTGGRRVRGADGYAGQIGHLQVGANYDPCACGRTGCWTTKVGPAAAGAAQTPGQRVTLGRWLGHGVAILEAVCDPGRIVLGGYFTALAPDVLPVARKALDRPDRLTVSVLDEYAAARGAAAASLALVPVA